MMEVEDPESSNQVPDKAAFTARISSPFGHFLGVTIDGVPAVSNGTSGAPEAEGRTRDSRSIAPAFHSLSRDAASGVEEMPPYAILGVKWDCVEFVRRYLACRKGVWLCGGVRTAEELWSRGEFESIETGKPVTCQHYANTSRSRCPSAGDILVWAPDDEFPTGHAAVVVSEERGLVRVAEQGWRAKKWERGQGFSREIRLQSANDALCLDDPKLQGWVQVEAPFLITAESDAGDDYRIITGRGDIVRQPVKPCPSLPWTNPSVAEGSAEFFLRHSLLNAESGRAKVTDVPTGFYHLDYNMWCRLRNGARSLHQVAMAATARVLFGPDSDQLLENYFGIPPALHAMLRRSWETTPALGGRFDFGTDGRSLKILEYNCDSSAALLECSDTQERMAVHYGVEVGDSTGAVLGRKATAFFTSVMQRSDLCPSHKLIHFLVDDDDEERYTALCMMQYAEAAGFRTKLECGISDLHFAVECSCESGSRGEGTPRIVDEDGESVEVVWKTWSWDTVLHQYAQMTKDESEETYEYVTLPDIFLNENVVVFEPFWKAVTGSKAILPFMYELHPDHELMLPCSFELTNDIARKPYISKPVNGRAGQNISMFEPTSKAEDKISADFLASLTDGKKRLDASDGNGNPEELERISSAIPSSASFGVSLKNSFELDPAMENSPGRFYDSVMVYQQRLFLRKFAHKYFPIFCVWMIGLEFGGVVVREDTSKITTLQSRVAPARVVRSDAAFNKLWKEYGKEEDEDEGEEENGEKKKG